eukprot:XP_014057749.1 PREDICTED: leucine-rich repeat-containing protein 16A-like [Salmo salar]
MFSSLSHSEVKLSMASFLSDRIVDEILESLSRCQNTLAEHLTRKAQPLLHQEPKETEVLDETVLQPEAQNQEQRQQPAESLEEMDTCVMTPKSKRKSILCRMLRPVSVAFEMEFDLDKALEEVPIHEEDSPPPPLSDKMPTYFGELPTMEARKLEHHTKLRPKPKKRTKPSRAPRDSICTSPPPEEVEQNGLLGKVDEGVDEFFYKKITQLSFKRPTLRGSSNIQEGSEKKRESRKSGFFNLIKSRTSKSSDKDKSEKNQSTPAPAQTPAPVTTVPEGPSSPKASLKSQAPEPPTKVKEAKTQPTHPSQLTQPLDCSSSSDRSEELRTPDSMDEVSDGDSKGSPQGGRRYGVQVMGTGLLAEMKAKQERRTFGSHKDQYDQSSSPDSSGSVKGQPIPTESRSPGGSKAEGVVLVGSPEKSPRGGEAKPETVPRNRITSSSSPKPPLQGTKPALAARPSILQKPRTSSSRSIDEVCDSPGGNVSPKGAMLPYSLKRVPLDKDKEGQGSPLLGGTGSNRNPSAQAAVKPGSVSDPAKHQSPHRHNSEDNVSKPKDQTPNPDRDKGPGRKSSQSGEEADKDFIFI